MTTPEPGSRDEREMLAEGLCPRSGQRIMPNGILRPVCAICDCGDDAAAAADRTTGGEADERECLTVDPDGRPCFMCRPVAPILRESVEDALENDRCGICLSVDHFREDCDQPASSVAPDSDELSTTSPISSQLVVDAPDSDQLRDEIGAMLHKWLGGDRDYYNAPASALVAGPLQQLCREHAERGEALERVRALVAFYDRHEYSSLDADDLRRALDGKP